jgi:hypothetical protein
VTADELHTAWPEAAYIVVPDAGHSAWEPPITAELVKATERFKARELAARAKDEGPRMKDEGGRMT